MKSTSSAQAPANKEGLCLITLDISYARQKTSFNATALKCKRRVPFFNTAHPHPSSQLTGLLGLCSQSLRCDCSWSSRSVAVQPKPALSQLICSLDSMLRMMRGTGRRCASVTTVRSTGQICCWANHWVMQALQNACSQCGAWEGWGTRGLRTKTGQSSN